MGNGNRRDQKFKISSSWRSMEKESGTQIDKTTGNGQKTKGSSHAFWQDACRITGKLYMHMRYYQFENLICKRFVASYDYILIGIKHYVSGLKQHVSAMLQKHWKCRRNGP